VNRFFERERMEDHQNQAGIFTNLDSADVEGVGVRPQVGLVGEIHSESRHGPFWYVQPQVSSQWGGGLLHESQGAQLAVLSGDSMRDSQGRLPKLNFPVFSGENLQLWRFRCENYFEMYAVESSLWIRVASMHLKGVAARWFQSLEKRVRALSWEEFCVLVHD
jgi:hypothetical protein